MRWATMLKLFFHLHECGTEIIDEEGVEVESLKDARLHAIRDERSIMSSEVRAGKLCLSCHISVDDAHGANVMTVTFREALEITGF